MITRKRLSKLLFFSLLLLTQASGFAQEKIAQAEISTAYSNPVFIILLCAAVLLLIMIVVFADVLKAAAWIKIETKQKTKQEPGKDGTVKTLLLLFALSGISETASAKNLANVVLSQSSYWGLDAFTFYMMVTIISLELLVIYLIYSLSMKLIGVEERKQKLREEKAKLATSQPSFIEKMNASVAIEEEAEIMLDHNYDGIQELDNNLPPWWKYGFYATIVWGIIYLIHFHVIKTGKLQVSEYENEIAEAKVEMEEYRKKAANLVDENNAILLTDNASIASGKDTYMGNCAACHGRAGEGGVGPNLTDEYWLHNGSIKDIFKTIKYGWPEKGMKSWQQDLSAKQIHEVSSYILSLKGTNPPNAKEKQGELYKAATIDSTQKATKTIADTAEVAIKETK